VVLILAGSRRLPGSYQTLFLFQTLNAISISGCLGVLSWLNLTRADKPKPFSSVDEHDEGNLVSERARRIPARVFKIHEQSAPAIGFTGVAVRENAIPSTATAKVLWYFIQGVGVVRNFGTVVERPHFGGNYIFGNIPGAKSARHICIFEVLASLSR
jgi:hypothetical protein